MIQSSTMSAVELVRANGFLPIEKHESAAVALDLTDDAVSRLETIMVNLHELSGTTNMSYIGKGN